MPKLAYQSSRNFFVKTFRDGINTKEDEYVNGQFNMVSAALVNYLPELPVASHENIYKDILLHKKLSILEQSTYEALDAVEVENFSDEIALQMKSKPTIICTFHTGSYRVLNLFLTKNNIPYSLVMGKAVVEQEGDSFRAMYNALSRNKAEHFNIIEAENPNVGLQMLRELKKGKSLLLYIDGNTGAGASTKKMKTAARLIF